VTTRKILFPVAVLAAVTLSACGNGGANAGSATGPPPISPTTATSPTSPVPPPPTPASPPPISGAASSTCVNGWSTPPPNSDPYLQPLGIIRRTEGVQGPFVVVDMRYFTGPESPPSQMGYIAEVQRWYVKLYAKDDPAFQGRFLVEARRFGRGVSAVAPYGTHGFSSPQWIGFQWDSADKTPRTYPDLPGQWAGIPYDFAKGGGGLTIPGLPSQVAGCLDGT
jgi:hypothetical protein